MLGLYIETLLGLEIVDEIDTTEDTQVIAKNKCKERHKRSGLITDNLSTEQAQTVPDDTAPSHQ